MADSTTPVEKDDELKGLELDLAKAQARAKLRDARWGGLSLLSPGTDPDRPKGVTTFGEGAGALGPYLAHRALADAAGLIASAAAGVLREKEHVHVLVTEDQALLESDARSHLLRRSLDLRTGQLEPFGGAIDAAKAALEQARAAIAAAEGVPPAGPGGESLDADTSTAAEPEGEASEAGDGAAGTDAPTPAAEETTAAVQPVALALDLVKLFAVDVGVSAVTVSTQASELAVLTGGCLAALEDSVKVTVDGFDVVAPTGPTLSSLQALADRTVVVDTAATGLAAAVAPVAQELAHLEALYETAAAAWTAAVKSDADEAVVEALRVQRDAIGTRADRRRGAVAPAQAVLDAAKAVVTAARTEIVTAMTVDDTGTSPAGRALARDRVADGSPERFSHVLLVRPTHLGGDIVTRRSVLGSSGRASYLGAATSAWALHEIADRRLVGGGPKAAALHMTHDLVAGLTSSPTDVEAGGDLPVDSGLSDFERKGLDAVLALAVALGVFALVMLIGIVF